MAMELLIAQGVGRRCQLHVLAVRSAVGFTSIRHVPRHLWSLIILFIATILSCFCRIHLTLLTQDDKSLDIPVNSITKVLETNDDGEATVIEHFTHKHYLMLSDNIREHGHKHPLLFYYDYEEQCSACGRDIIRAFRCKDCNLELCNRCVLRPIRVKHKCDEHLLTLTYDKISDYVKCHYCDICEKERDPKHWFYHCKTCDTSVHVDCVLGKYSFIKLGSTYNEGNHEHPLTFVKKIYYYPECVECGDPCEDLSLECAESGCNYIAHWKCR
ncbi:Transcription intermediary factor 1-beta [Gossypium arboreum]|uniref:Transcription intermediary factor 1-beta n=1 Tax=Gossypium arboreum TaxID=29729 RepID=A0A0B0PFZ2_GOSAR|nr:Transcription intermediary factor 1-beta [Gossypium arboreum]